MQMMKTQCMTLGKKGLVITDKHLIKAQEGAFLSAVSYQQSKYK